MTRIASKFCLLVAEVSHCRLIRHFSEDLGGTIEWLESFSMRNSWLNMAGPPLYSGLFVCESKSSVGLPLPLLSPPV